MENHLVIISVLFSSSLKCSEPFFASAFDVCFYLAFTIRSPNWDTHYVMPFTKNSKTIDFTNCPGPQCVRPG